MYITFYNSLLLFLYVAVDGPVGRYAPIDNAPWPLGQLDVPLAEC